MLFGPDCSGLFANWKRVFVESLVHGPRKRDQGAGTEGPGCVRTQQSSAAAPGPVWEFRSRRPLFLSRRLPAGRFVLAGEAAGCCGSPGVNRLRVKLACLAAEVSVRAGAGTQSWSSPRTVRFRPLRSFKKMSLGGGDRIHAVPQGRRRYGGNLFPVFHPWPISFGASWTGARIASDGFQQSPFAHDGMNCA
jgi:hypothetical protein